MDVTLVHARVLESPTRRRIYDLIVAQPGISISALARESGEFWGTVEFHVLRLAAAGLVVSRRVGRRRVVLPRQEATDFWQEERILLHEPACRRIALALVEEPGSRVLQLHAATGLTERVLYHHLRHLMEAGLVRSAEARYYRGLEPTPKLYSLLMEGVLESEGGRAPKRTKRS